MLDITRKQKNKAKSKYRYIRKMVLFAHCLLFFGCKDKSKEIRNTFLTGFRENGVYAAFFNPITQDVYVGTGEGRILLYTPDLVLKDTMKVKKGVVATTLCSPDGKYMVSTSIDGYLYIWDIQERKLVPYFKNKSHSLQSMTCLFSPLQKYVASTGADSTVVILSWPEKKIVKSCKSEHGFIRFAWFSEDDSEIIWANDGGELYVEDMSGGQPPRHAQISKYAFSCVVSSYAQNELALACDDGHVYIVDYKTLKIKQQFPAHEGPVFVALWNPDFTELSSIGADGYIRMWVKDKDAYVLKQEIKAHDGVICTLYYNMDGTRLVSGGQDGWVKIWDAKKLTTIDSVDTKIR